MNIEDKDIISDQNNEIINKDPFEILSERIKNENIDETIKSLRKRIDSKYNM